ncbi:HAD family hydrolase [Martelella endophytica]|uniref:Phosphoglycolate phosphatase n=1 Tax=Martelella endophytica TaxID=1486262 RepID=A0A0D5LTK8_MAREN|nr:HAD family hydrolase [Martelella endophytica]AJY47097.1 phosphoglycolate phosphatase [Martelella endophytica]
MSSPLAIFDLDGTLIDTAPDLIDSLNHAIAPHGLPPFGVDKVKLLVGRGVKVMIQRAFAFHDRTLDGEAFDACFARFTEHYRAGMPGKSRPYPGLLEALARLKDAGYGLAVCTNKREELTMPLLEALDLAEWFGTITCGDTFEYRKPDPRHVSGTIERAGATVAHAVMIGDSANDIDAAKGADVSTVAVTFGYTEKPAEELGADKVISHFDRLTPALLDTLIGR